MTENITNIVEEQSMVQESIIAPLPKKSTKLNTIVIASILGIIFLTLLFVLVKPMLHLEKVNPVQTSNEKLDAQSVSATPKPSALPVIKTDAPQVYKNEKLNFQFNYPGNTYKDGELSIKHNIIEKENQLIINTSEYNVGTDKERKTQVTWDIYEASSSAKDNLVGWWKKSVTNEINDHRVPQDYTTKLNFLSFDECIKECNPTWVAPPSLEVTVKEGIEPPDFYQGSLYYFFDFGKPFIIHETIESTGACGGCSKNNDDPFTTIRKLN